jgi:hypothetical protein
MPPVAAVAMIRFAAALQPYIDELKEGGRI